jgi:hypothetical protein
VCVQGVGRTAAALVGYLLLLATGIPLDTAWRLLLGLFATAPHAVLLWWRWKHMPGERSREEGGGWGGGGGGGCVRVWTDAGGWVVVC